MGMYSSLQDEDIEVTDLEGLKDFLKRWNKKFPDWKYEGMLTLDNEFTFESWDGHKIIQYWYDHTVAFLKCVAKYIEGYVSFLYETDDEKANIEFLNGKCKINLGRMNYEDISPEDFLSRNKDKKDDLNDFLLVEEI